MGIITIIDYKFQVVIKTKKLMLPWRITLGGVRVVAATSALPGSVRRLYRCSSGAAADPAQRSSSAEHNKRGPSLLLVGTAGVIASGLGIVWYLQKERSDRDQSFGSVPFPHLKAASSSSKETEDAKLSVRECRYKDFSSLYFNGELYMTPRDFLESVTLNKPRCK